jgi:hypothetical protein
LLKKKSCSWKPPLISRGEKTGQLLKTHPMLSRAAKNAKIAILHVFSLVLLQRSSVKYPEHTGCSGCAPPGSVRFHLEQVPVSRASCAFMVEEE